MLWDAGQKRVVRQAEERYELLVTAVAQGTAVASSREAWQAWQSRHGATPPRDAAAQAATLGRLASLFPGSVTRRS